MMKKILPFLAALAISGSAFADTTIRGPITLSPDFSVVGARVSNAIRGLNPLNFYINRSTGLDTNDCLAATTGGGHGPCKTITHTASVALKTDAQGFYLLINVAAGTYPEPVLLAGVITGSGVMPIAGQNNSNVGAPMYILGAGSGSTKVDVTTGTGCLPFGNGFTVSNGFALILDKLEVSTTCAGGSDLFIQNGSYVGFGSGDVILGPATTSYLHIEAHAMAETNGFKISGAVNTGFGLSQLSFLEIAPNAVITCTGTTPAFSDSLFSMQDNAVATFGTGASFSGCGAVTGARYNLSGGSILDVQPSASATFLPGNAVGSIKSGARYVPGGAGANAPAASPCGSSPSVVGGDDGGVVTVGGAGPITSCSVSYAYPTSNTRYCTLSWNQAAIPPAISSMTANGFAFTAGAVDMAGTLVYYTCRLPN